MKNLSICFCLLIISSITTEKVLCQPLNDDLIKDMKICLLNAKLNTTVRSGGDGYYYTEKVEFGGIISNNFPLKYYNGKQFFRNGENSDYYACIYDINGIRRKIYELDDDNKYNGEPIRLGLGLKRAEEINEIGISGKTEEFGFSSFTYLANINTNNVQEIGFAQSTYKSKWYLTTKSYNINFIGDKAFLKKIGYKLICFDNLFENQEDIYLDFYNFNRLDYKNSIEFVQSTRLSNNNILIIVKTDYKYLSYQLNSMFGIGGMNNISRTLKSSPYYKFIVLSEDGSKVVENKNYNIPIKFVRPTDNGFIILSDNLGNAISLNKNDFGKKSVVFSKSAQKNIVVNENVNISTNDAEAGIKIFKFDNNANFLTEKIIENPKDKDINRPVPKDIVASENYLCLRYISFEKSIINVPFECFMLLDFNLNEKSSLIGERIEKDKVTYSMFGLGAANDRFYIGSEQFHFPSNSNYIPSPIDNGKKETTSIKPIVYGEEKDVDGNIYKTVKIGSQDWMAENLKVTKFSDGSSIPLIDLGWKNLATPAYCWYDNDTINKNIYGALYNWYAVNTGKLCPKGWHVPSNADWKNLNNNHEGGEFKEEGTSHWKNPNEGATNKTGFTALPGGWRDSGSFRDIGNIGNFWSSSVHPNFNTMAIFVGLLSEYSITSSHAYDFKSGLSVRCLKDN